ncbi:hypothetical protein ABZ403_12050 [Micromonospora zamorensis]|uniref:hypothetical protein n=1 Tax=Micromonospora zamorensis TaxID=709883 RepID=UPI0033E214C3
MTTLRDITRRVTIITTALIVGLTASYAPSQAAEGGARTTVTDHPGAPGTMLQRFEDLTGRPVGDLDKVLAVDAGGRDLTSDQLAALVAGEKVDGVKVVGTMPGGRDILGATMADLADGAYDGKGDTATGTTSLIFASSVPGGRDWCLTMCVASGKSIWECLLSRRAGESILTLDLSGDTTIGGTKAAFEKANGVTVSGPSAVETLVGDGEPSAKDVEMLLDGKDVDSLRRVATVEGPDAGWTLADIAENSGVVYAKTRAHIFTVSLPLLGKLLVVCISQDGGKTWKCSARQWDGF